MKNGPGNFVGVCRRCKKETRSAVPDVRACLQAAASGLPIPSKLAGVAPIRVPMYGVHECQDGGIGVADVIGAEFATEAAAAPQRVVIP